MIDTKSSNRAALFRVACLALFTGSAAFTNPGMAARSAVPMTEPLRVSLVPSMQSSRNLSSVRMAASKAQSMPTLPRLTAEEESELLRQAVELRRITNLESEMALKSPTREMPLLSIRAKAAGYGEELEAYEDAKYDGQKARELLVTRNMGLVHYCVKQILGKYKGNRLNSLSRDDLVQEGAIGLSRAVDKWNPEIGGKFSTYAVYWVRAAVFRCIAERDDLLRVPSHVSVAVRKINKASKRLGLDLDTSLSWKQANAAKKLAEEAGLSEKNFNEAMKVRSRRYSGGYVAFESWMQKGQDLSTDSPTMYEQEQGLSSLESEHLVSTLSEFLKPKEIEALSWRYGLVNDDDKKVETPAEKANRYMAEAESALFNDGNSQAAAQPQEITAKGRWGEAMSFKEVGKKMEVSAEYGRKLCHAALAKLKQAADDGRLEPALLF